MKPKYIFYLFIIVVIHYEVGRIVSVTTTQAADEQPSSQKGVKLDENRNQSIAPVYEQRVRFIRVNNHYKRHRKVWNAAYKKS